MAGTGAFARLIETCGGARVVGPALGVPESHARAMKTRDSVAPTYWPAFIKLARRRGVWLTEEMLVAAYAQRWPRSKRSSA